MAGSGQVSLPAAIPHEVEGVASGQIGSTPSGNSPATQAVLSRAGSTVTGPQRGDRQALAREGIVSLEALTESLGLCPRDLNPRVSEGGRT
jgi:hypothetical protein